MPSVTLLVARNLGIPIFAVAFDLPGALDAVRTAMPKAAMNEDNGSPASEDKVRLAGKVLPVKAVSKTAGVQPSSDGQFGRSILTTDTSHVLAALPWRKPVH